MICWEIEIGKVEEKVFTFLEKAYIGFRFGFIDNIQSKSSFSKSFEIIDPDLIRSTYEKHLLFFKILLHDHLKMGDSCSI